MRDDAGELRRLLVDPLVVASALGIAEGARRHGRSLMVRCPWHSERTPSCSLTVAADGTLRAHCFACDRGGDVLDLIAEVRGLTDFRDVLREAAAIAGYDQHVGFVAARAQHRRSRSAPTPTPRPPHAEVDALWNSSASVARTLVEPHALDLAVAFYLASRRWYAPALAVLDLVRVTPLPDAYDWPSWWPSEWTRDWRLVMRAYDAAGELASLHARACTASAEPKTRWPRGCASSGLMFADRRGVALLRGELGDTERVIVVEGFADVIAASVLVADNGKAWAVLGIASGSARALAAVRWPALPIVVATHADAAGERYAADARAAIPSSTPVFRSRFASQEAAHGRG